MPSIGPNFAMLIAIVMILLTVASMLTLLRCYKHPPSGSVLVVRGPGRVQVSRFGTVVLPVIHSAEVVDLTMQPVSLVLAGSDALVSADDQRLNAEVDVNLQVREDDASLIQIVDRHGVDFRSKLQGLYAARLTARVREFAASIPAFDFLERRQQVTDQLQREFGNGLDEFNVCTVIIQSLAPADTPP